MNKLKRLLKRKATWIILILFVFVYVNNSSFFAKREDGTPLLLLTEDFRKHLAWKRLRVIHVQQNV